MTQTIRTQSGVSLLEMIIFIGLISTIFLAIVAASTHTIRQTITNQRKIIATRYAEEVDEWMRGEKETNWTAFSARSPGTFCMNADITTCDTAGTCWNDTGACGDVFELDDVYRRTIILTTNGSRIDVQTTVDWLDGPNTFSVSRGTTFSAWE